jgi:hypothetical protein
MEYSPVEIALALCLFDYNVDPSEKALLILEESKNLVTISEMRKLKSLLMKDQYITALPIPTVRIYVKAALKKYGKEAKRRVDEYTEVIDPRRKP